MTVTGVAIMDLPWRMLKAAGRVSPVGGSRTRPKYSDRPGGAPPVPTTVLPNLSIPAGLPQPQRSPEEILRGDVLVTA